MVKKYIRKTGRRSYKKRVFRRRTYRKRGGM